jgi:hypothetical protein
MILRRLSQSLKTQNWTAIWIEFILLVVGVFLGIQVANWNEERTFSAQEQNYLQELKDEVAESIKQVNYRTAYSQVVLDSGEKARQFLQQDAPCKENCSALLAKFFLASQIWGTPLSRSTFNEMQRLGLPRSKEIKARMLTFYNTTSGMEITTDAAPPYRVHVRGFMTVDVIKGLWQDCWSIENGNLETLHPECKAPLTNEEASTVLEKLHQSAGLIEELNFWMGMNEFGIQTYPNMINAGNEVIVVIDKEINK